MSEQLRIVPMTFAEACAFITAYHRHHPPPQGHKFSLGVLAAGRRVGVATVGRPVARLLDDGLTLEVTRVATDGTTNACSALYGAAWRVARHWGYRRLITYTQHGESGASVRAAGWRKVADRSPRPGWHTPSRPRRSRGADQTARTLWQITTHDAPDLPSWRDETRDETTRLRKPRCRHCRGPMTPPTTGRPPTYCSHACRQAAYRTRTKEQPA